MTQIRIGSVAEPFTGRDALDVGIDLVRRASSLGLAPSPEERALDLALVRDIARDASALGLGTAAAQALMGIDPEDPPERAVIEDLVARLRDALVESAVPLRELRALVAIVHPAGLADLLGISQISLRRYAAGERPVPDRVAARAHWLSLVVSDLLGAYNDFGVRRWFERSRAQLGGQSPRQALGADWDPDGGAAGRVAALAAALVGGGGAG